jgi:hypothetical protein
MTQNHSIEAKSVEPTGREELAEQQLAEVAGGFLVFHFKLVAVKTVSWAHDDT